jgi:flagellar L-ring protein FlgH
MKRLLAVLAFAMAAPAAQAADLYNHGNWPALASDRLAHRVGDIVEIVISESAAAQDTATNSSARSNNVGGSISADTVFSHNANLALQNGSNTTGTTGRSGGIVALVSAHVDEVLPNGDLRVSGTRALNINGEQTNIKIKGIVRTADIASDNSVPSSRLADAMIDYDGAGFVSKSSAPGIVTRVFNWLGL